MLLDYLKKKISFIKNWKKFLPQYLPNILQMIFQITNTSDEEKAMLKLQNNTNMMQEVHIKLLEIEKLRIQSQNLSDINKTPVYYLFFIIPIIGICISIFIIIYLNRYENLGFFLLGSFVNMLKNIFFFYFNKKQN